MERPADGEPSLTEASKPETVPGGLVSSQTSPNGTASAPQNSPPTYRQNHVGTAMLYGVRIVSLIIDDKERLCLAQISNTLLKDYSYNEIHNRRVALGITCVQCTPVQLEILRRAGAMPISSRRCGMITKREAERLVKSFLEDTSPPKLPENFAFDVKHACGWGGRGNFIPSRYNSSRAKCIKCCYCHMFFSPNKFIFHYHRTADSKYNHPDAANFNSWRRHLKLTDNNASDDLVHAWEDVKAMFNGGNRKRVFTGPSYSRPNGSDGAKKAKLEPQRIPGPPPPNATLGPIPSPQPPYHYPVFPIPNKLYPVKARAAHPAFPIPFPYDKPMMAESDNISVKPSPHSPNSSWNGGPDTMYPPYEMIWAKHLGLSSNESNYATSFPKVSPKQLSPYRLSPPPLKPSMESSSVMLRNHDCRDISPVGICREEQRVKEAHDLESAADHAMLSNRHEHFSAFRPVAGKVPTDELSSPGSHPQCYSTPESHSPGSLARLSTSPSSSPHDGRDFIGSESSERPEPEEDGVVEEDSESDCENVDVDTVDEPEEENNNLEQQKRLTNEFETGPKTPQDVEEDGKSHEEKETPGEHDEQPKETFESGAETQEESEEQPTEEHENQSLDKEPSHCDSAEDMDIPEESMDREENDDSGVAEDSDEKENIQGEPSDHLASLSKDELQRELATQLQTRRRLEEDCKVIKDTFQEQVKREQQYREEMAKQLQIVRETLCHELDQERKARFSLQQKLKEAHDALHNFSCKLLASRECSDCTYKEPVIPR